MPDLDIESLARRAGVEADAWMNPISRHPVNPKYRIPGVTLDDFDVPLYSAPAVAAMLAQMRREVEAQAEQDAKRYRFLREHFELATGPREWTYHHFVFPEDAEQVDAAIDAALQRLAEKG